MLRQFFTRKGITDLLGKVRLGGFTVSSHLSQNRKNTKATFKNLFRQLVMGEATIDTTVTQVGKIAKTRKRQTLSTLKNVMSAVRGQARSIMASGQSGYWLNQGVLDGKTTEICMQHIGMTWDVPYGQIPNKPPRVPPVHPCRSFLVFVPEGADVPNQAPFMEQFEASPELQAELLGPVRYAAFVAGTITIASFAEFEQVVLTTTEELGIDE